MNRLIRNARFTLSVIPEWFSDMCVARSAVQVPVFCLGVQYSSFLFLQKCLKSFDVNAPTLLVSVSSGYGFMKLSRFG